MTLEWRLMKQMKILYVMLQVALNATERACTAKLAMHATLRTFGV